MKYSYEYYKSNTFTWPLIACCICVIMLISVLVGLIKGRDNFKLIYIPGIIVLVALLISSSIMLSYGYKLALDEKDDIQFVEGKIEKIDKVINSPVYKLEDGNSKASIIYISGQRYYIMSDRQISINDEVEISYLENSKFIVEIKVK